ncbi:MAG: SAM-dependent methyltransferase [Acidobacteriota bacterium]|nr:SAM-dependent methyltransferase [Acidobacteriota bacterium]
MRLAIGLVSGAAIAYQLLLMRLFSIVQWHHFASLVISLALLGYGASGALLTLLRRPLLARFTPALAGLMVLFGLLAPLSFAAAQRLRLNPLELLWDPRQLAALGAVYLLLALPFVCAGAAVGLALARYEDAAHRIYQADLLGAAAGAVAILAALYQLAPGTCLRLVGAAGGLAAAVALVAGSGSLSPRWRRAAAALCAVAVAAPFGWPADWLTPRLSEYKAQSKALAVPGAEIVARRSSPLGTLAAVRSPRIPFRIAPGASFAFTGEIPEQIVLFADGEVAGVVDRGSANGGGDAGAYLDFLPAALPFLLAGDGARVALLGNGPGATLALALRHGAAAVEVVEVDPLLPELVVTELADFTAGLYRDPRVRLHAVDPRGFLAARRGPFDLVVLPSAESGGAPGARALEESYVHTVAAFELALARLGTGGILAAEAELAAPPVASVKLVATAVAALERSALAAPERLAAIRSWGRFLLLVKPAGLTPGDVAAIRAFCADRSFDLVYYPGMPATEANRRNLLDRPALYEATRALLGAGRDDFLRGYKLYAVPATDDRPYFFRTFRWRSLPELLRLRTRGGAALVEWSYLLLAATLAQAVLAGLLLILLPLWWLRRRPPASHRPGGTAAGRRAPGEAGAPAARQASARASLAATAGAGRVGLYFLCLGLAFLFLEIAFIQHLTLFLAHPLLAAAVVLAGFLLFAGLGSGASRRFERALERRRPGAVIPTAVAAILLAVLSSLTLAAALVARCAGWPSWLKVPLALLAIAPLAFFLGMPFPLALRRVAAARPDLVPWAWGVNGWASVLAAVLATLLAVHLGFTAVVGAACALYVVAGLAAPRAAA